MIKIRLKRLGKKNRPSFRIVVMPARTKRDGRTIEDIGHYNPFSKELSIKTERAKYWLSQGVKPSDTVLRLFIKNNILKAEDYPAKKFSNKPGKKALERSKRKKEKTEGKEVKEKVHKTQASNEKTENIPEKPNKTENENQSN